MQLELFQSLGCIPRELTPSPNPIQLLEHLQRTTEVKKPNDAEKSHKIAELEAKNRDTKRKVDGLERKMARLLSRGSPKAAKSFEGEVVPTATASESDITDADAIRDLQGIKNPKPKENVTIDLTGDSRLILSQGNLPRWRLDLTSSTLRKIQKRKT